MPDTPTFVVNDRRKFTSDGDLRHEGVPPSEPSNSDGALRPQLVPSEPVSVAGSTAELSDLPESDAIGALHDEPVSEGSPDAIASLDEFTDDPLPPGPTEEQITEATRAYEATVDRLDTALRAADPGGERMPEMSFERLTQSLYTQALMLLGGAAQPGETPRVDILGARQTIDMLSIIGQKAAGNLSSDEDKLLQSALFDLRMGFLEITQALARQAAQRQMGGPGAPPPGSGPRIVR
ncbi:MAG: DUF1844 domain-containing protein [Janthinobacterium lividum]